jgi:hypothetical protein
MGPDQGDRDPARGRAESRAAAVGAGAAVTGQARAATVFVRAAAKKRRISWELPVLISNARSAAPQ